MKLLFSGVDCRNRNNHNCYGVVIVNIMSFLLLLLLLFMPLLSLEFYS